LKTPQYYFNKAAPDTVAEFSTEEACFYLEEIELEGMFPHFLRRLRLPGTDWGGKKKRAIFVNLADAV
jgi:hypothetical protein